MGSFQLSPAFGNARPYHRLAIANITEHFVWIQKTNKVMFQSKWKTASHNIRNRQPMIRASVTERWAQLKTGNMILSTHDIIFSRNEKY